MGEPSFSRRRPGRPGGKNRCFFPATVVAKSARMFMSTTKVAILGAGFIADIHLESYHRFVRDAEVVAVYTRQAERAEAFANKHRLAGWFNDL